MTERESGTARTRDGAILAFHRIKGNAEAAPRLVLIHSLALDGSVWDGVVAHLAGRADVIAYDCRGHGRSDHAPGPYTVEQFADDLADLLDKVGWRDAVVAGCSMGGCVAQAFAARHPKRVRGLVLIDTTAWYGANAPTEWRKRAETARTDGLAKMAAFQITRWFGDAFRANQPQRVNAAMAVFVANDVECYAATCDMLGHADLRSFLGSFRMPVAVVVGEEDYATPIPAAQHLAESITGATLAILPHARHLTPIESPDVIGDHILALCRRVNAEAASAAT